MLKIIKVLAAIVGGVILLFASLQALPAAIAAQNPSVPATQIPPTAEAVSIEPPVDINSLPLRDNPNVYQYDDPGSVVTMYVTVRRGNASDNSDHPWSEVNSYTKWFFTNNKVVVVGKADAILQVGDENGPKSGMLGYGINMPNATIQIRGASTSMMPQKSFKIELKKGEGTWRGQRVVALNKQIFDPSRIRNKLNFDLLKQIPNLVSLRTQFVHLYIKDETTNPWQDKFEDYGLFTEVELPDRTYLKVHGLDPDGQLYKPTFFEFDRYPDQIRLVTDPSFVEDDFSSKLEIKGNRDNSKLINMLYDLNNYDIPITTTFEKYFDADNYFTWMAYNILVDSEDTSSENYYLYGPHNSNKFYFIPWDYDDSFNRLDRVNIWHTQPFYSYEYGVTNYWGTRLANRVLREAQYRKMLDDKVNELMTFLTPERISSMVALYKPVAEKYALVMPDFQYLPTQTKQDFETDFEDISKEVQNNYNLYKESLQDPMPFYLGTPVVENGELSFNWDEAYDFNGSDITYRFLISRDPLFTPKELVVDESFTNLNEFRFTASSLKPGDYFWRVVATNAAGKSQLPFDSFYTDSNAYSGVKRFTLTPDGQVVEK